MPRGDSNQTDEAEWIRVPPAVRVQVDDDVKTPKLWRLSQIRQLEKRLRSKGTFSYSDFEYLYQYGDVIVMSPERESLAWDAHHKVIEEFRRLLVHDTPTALRMRDEFLQFLARAANFYKEIVQEVRNEPGGLTRDILGGWENREKERNIMLAVHNCCRQILLHIGDLERYKFLYSGVTLDRSSAQAYYEIAFEIDYSVGEPQNQLGTLMLYTDNYPACVYHFLRGIFIECPSSTCNTNLSMAMERLDHKKQRRDKATDPQTRFSYAFWELARILIRKNERLPPEVLDLALDTFPKKNAVTSIYVIVTLAASVDDFYTRKIKRINKQIDIRLLHDDLKALLKFASLFLRIAHEDRDTATLPAVSILFLWLARQREVLKAILETDWLVTVFIELLTAAEALLLGLSADKLDGLLLRGNKDLFFYGIKDLWEDQKVRGFTLFSFLHQQQHHSTACNRTRGLRIKASLSYIAEALPVGSPIRALVVDRLLPRASGSGEHKQETSSTFLVQSIDSAVQERETTATVLPRPPRCSSELQEHDTRITLLPCSGLQATRTFVPQPPGARQETTTSLLPRLPDFVGQEQETSTFPAKQPASGLQEHTTGSVVQEQEITSTSLAQPPGSGLQGHEPAPRASGCSSVVEEQGTTSTFLAQPLRKHETTTTSVVSPPASGVQQLEATSTLLLQPPDLGIQEQETTATSLPPWGSEVQQERTIATLESQVMSSDVLPSQASNDVAVIIRPPVF